MVLVGSLLVYGLGIWDVPVLSHNEARRLVVVQEMPARHSWLLPTKNGLIYLEKPPLFYWAGGLIGMLTGICPVWVLRLPSALSALGIVWLLFGRMRRHIGDWAALFAAMMLVSSYFFAEMARLAELNMMLALWVFAAMLMCFCFSARSRSSLFTTWAIPWQSWIKRGSVSWPGATNPIIYWPKSRIGSPYDRVGFACKTITLLICIAVDMWGFGRVGSVVHLLAWRNKQTVC